MSICEKKNKYFDSVLFLLVHRGYSVMVEIQIMLIMDLICLRLQLLNDPFAKMFCIQV